MGFNSGFKGLIYKHYMYGIVRLWVIVTCKASKSRKRGF